jgi:NCS1 family nucleobase:cation symporter-1
MENAATIFALLGYIGGALGPVAGIMLADFHLIRRRNYDLDRFYTRDGQYDYVGGWNPKVMAVTAVGLDSLGFLAGYTWFVGLAVAYFARAVLRRPQRSAVAPEPTMETGEELR